MAQKNMATQSLLENYGEWIFRIVILSALCAQLYLTKSFVTRSEFESQSKDNVAAHLTIQTSVSDIATTMKILANTVTKLDDHESRLRVVELRQTDVIARLSSAERSADRAAAAAAAIDKK